MITIQDQVLCKLRLSFDGLVTMKEVLLESSHCIETELDVVVEVIKIHISVFFELYLDDYFI